MSSELYILYVEDNEGDVELLDLCIKRYSYSKKIIIDIAETVEEAKELFDIDKHSVALIDWNLPDGEGTEVVLFIRNLNKNTPIFMLSSGLSQRHMLEAEKYNPTACLEKNYNKDFVHYIYSFL